MMDCRIEKLYILLHCMLIFGGSLAANLNQLTSRGESERLPLYAPDKCKDPNQMLYPEDNDSWTCDCGPGFIYYKPKDACFLPYRQGPCPPEEHLIFNKSKRTTSCLKNPCQDGFARFDGDCFELGRPGGPCGRPQDVGPKILDVNSTTLEVECLDGGAETLHLFDVGRRCSPGSRRDSTGTCRDVF
ncbi:uncharacterized protein LOC109593908 [Aethina tumida]|uniref:uncharacterized protein LOC109593908 n=1 Tax=Aethina tumida TaxID=116153 RepID=UPI002147CE09|nr:uncharacterized protein LOC109593908 [Aethina tumida]XP_049823244.1 uncharacterized protein LOC109593908 [Aethina tumida]XP_049823245.1 uncharacterized protein LOC109593908 [Aethina tumida]